MNTSVFVSTFLAASIEVIEMVAIIVAVGVTRQWRGALAGTSAGLLVLAVLIAALGTALQGVPLRQATWGLVRSDVPAWWLLPPVVLGATVSSLYRAVLREG